MFLEHATVNILNYNMYIAHKVLDYANICQHLSVIMRYTTKDTDINVHTIP